MSRRIGRILAFQALYSWGVGGVNIEDLLNFSWIERDVLEDNEEVAKEGSDIKYCLYEKTLKSFEALDEDKKEAVFAFSRLLVKGTMEHLDEIDDLIKAHLTSKWTIDRINKVVLSVIRIGVYELLYQKDTPRTTVIDEAVEIVKDYGNDDSHKFTNAILDNISKDISK